MRGFDYLRDTPPDVIELIAEWRLPRRLYGAAAALTTILVVAVAAGCIEGFRIHDALVHEERASAEFDRSRARLATAKLSYERIERLIAIDRALSRMRDSGSTLVVRIARIGNLVPRGAWLQSIDPIDADSVDVRGEATGIDAIDRVLAKLAGAPQVGQAHLVAVSRRARVALAPTVTFELRLRGGR